ncbi:MAG: hypothetical protein H6623_07755 [Bdellovibrionaceae bacterium]|nr:hypothetical protein [Pseudobdellovibrionaceae bacterium]
MKLRIQTALVVMMGLFSITAMAENKCQEKAKDSCTEDGYDIPNFVISCYDIGSEVTLDGKKYVIADVGSDGGGSLAVKLTSKSDKNKKRNLICGEDITD